MVDCAVAGGCCTHSLLFTHRQGISVRNLKCGLCVQSQRQGKCLRWFQCITYRFGARRAPFRKWNAVVDASVEPLLLCFEVSGCDVSVIACARPGRLEALELYVLRSIHTDTQMISSMTRMCRHAA